MSFTQAALIIVAAAAVVLGLVCYHLLSRLDLLERAVHGGMEPPSRRLGREEYEQRFARALARSALAKRVQTGVVIVIGAEGSQSEAAGALSHLARGDGVFVMATDPAGVAFVENGLAPGTTVLDHDPSIGIVATPYALVVDDAQITAATPIPTGDDLRALVSRHT